MTRYGYAAMNVTLREEDVRTNRGMKPIRPRETSRPSLIR